MSAIRLAKWVLVSSMIAAVLLPVSAAAMPHAGAAPQRDGASHGVAMAQGTGQGCGYEHGPRGHAGTDGNADDNNGAGNDSDHDHDCTEQNPS